MNFFNALQVESSQRFLYASHDEFDLAKRFLDLRPELRNRDRLFRVGEIGHAPPRSANLPPGEWLYLETTDGNALLAISDSGTAGLAHEMSTSDLDGLKAAIRRQPFVRAEIVADTGGGGMRSVEIEILSSGPPVRFRLVHADAGLRALDAAISRAHGPR